MKSYNWAALISANEIGFALRNHKAALGFRQALERFEVEFSIVTRPET